MEKTINISGHDVRCRCTAKTLLIYKAQTGREWLEDVQELQQVIKKANKSTPAEQVIEANNGTKCCLDVAKLNTETAMNVAWSMAKTADKTIPDVEEWLDEFDSFPVLTVMVELYPMMNQALQVDRKNV